jgi:MFS family permease
VSLGTLQTSWSIAGNTSTAEILIAKFGWDEAQARRNNSFINSVGLLGLIFGALSAGFFIPYGRRKATITWQLVAIVGCGISLVRTLPTILIGRFLIGLCAGVMNVCTGKSIVETAP